MKQIPCWGPTIREWTVDITVIWCFLLGACELMHIFACKGKAERKHAEKIRCHRTKFCRQGNLRPALYSNVPYVDLNLQTAFLMLTSHNLTISYHTKQVLPLTYNYCGPD
jgi:hypothetical protein